jgi:predicted transcriptional regulator
VYWNEEFVMSRIKQEIMEFAKNLPDECTWDDVMYHVYVRQKIDAGLKEAEEGSVIDHDEVFTKG